MNAFETGRLVSSMMGHDKGHSYVVVDVLPDGSVLVADGRIRTIANPKRKNPKHLVAEPICFSGLKEKLMQGTAYDFEIITALRNDRAKEA